MTEQETASLLNAISAYYQNFKMNNLSVKAWYAALKNYDYNLVKRALVDHIKENKYAPTVSEIIDQINQQKDAKQLTALESWASVVSLIKKHGYYAQQEALAEMTEYTQRAVSMIGWQALCMMPVDEQPIYRAQYERAYQTVKNRKKLDQKYLGQEQLPEEIKKLIEVIA